jgi:uncharacterized membrane protein YkoI
MIGLVMFQKGQRLCLVVAILVIASAPLRAQEPADAATSSVEIGDPSRVTPPAGGISSSDSGSRPSSDTGVPRVLAYGAILKKVKKEVPGDIVNVSLKLRQRGQWTYEFTVLDRQGRSTRLLVNAQTAAILSKTRR